MNRFVVAEPTLCIGCNTCMAACTIVHKAVGLQSHPRLTVTMSANKTAPVLCRHCEDASCVRVCPVNAITYQDNTVVLNETVCIGCRLCAIACPFGAITPSGTPCTGVVSSHLSYRPAVQEMAQQDISTHTSSTLDPILNWTPGVRSIAVKCDMCDFREEGPECVRVCPTKALFVVDPQSLVQSRNTKQKLAAAALDKPLLYVDSQEPK